MRTDREYLLSAARLALRGRGRAEPNPLVGCVIAAPNGEVVGWGYHERCGEPHAEIHALRRAGSAARGATAYVTLAPCNHVGRTGPCSQALIEAGVARVVVARDDPNAEAAGGIDALRDAGIEVAVTDCCPEATAVSDPFAHRVRTDLPWVIVKWAQSLDGRIATRAGESQWISSEASRRSVHRERGRVDVILTGIGTVLRDDPMLTARNVRVQRVARRVIIDPELKTPLHARLVQTAREWPITIVTDQRLLTPDCRLPIADRRVPQLSAAGVDLVGVPATGCGLAMKDVLRELVVRYDATNVLVEAGPGLMSRLFHERLATEAWVFIAGLLLGDDAIGCVRGFSASALAEGIKLRTVRRQIRGGDTVLRYRVVNPPAK